MHFSSSTFLALASVVVASSPSGSTVPFKQYTTTNGVTYSYLSQAPTNTSKPTILFLHGFPDNAHGWDSQLDYFSSQGYGFVAPDLLGYGATDKPLNTHAFIMKDVADSLLSILDHEGVGKVVVASHDWGVAPASSINNYHQDRVLATVFTSVPYQPPGIKDFANLTTADGRPRFGYWDFLTKDYAACMIEKRLESFLSDWFAQNTSVWDYSFLSHTHMEAWVANDTRTPVASWLSSSAQKELLDNWKRDGFHSSLLWYVAGKENVDWIADQYLPESAYFLEKPTLQFKATFDNVSPIEAFEDVAKTYIKDSTIKQVESSHWIMREKPEIWNSVVEKFLQEKLGF